MAKTLAKLLLDAANKGTNAYAGFKALTAEEIGEILTMAREDYDNSIKVTPGKSATHFALFDDDPVNRKEGEEIQKCVAEYGTGCVQLGFDGYGDAGSAEGHGRPVTVEYYGNQVRVLVWADINQEDPTHIIPLDEAKEEKRRA